MPRPTALALPLVLPLVLSAALAACGPAGVDEDTGETADTADTGDTSETDAPAPEDKDDDGYTTEDDCDDLDPRINPGVDEVPWNGEDDDCDGRADADGTSTATAGITFVVVYEGTRYSWALQCPTTLTRTGPLITLQMECTPPADDPIALLALGETLTLRERDNIATDGLFDGAITVSSSDGWSVQGGARLVWRDMDTILGEVEMSSRFAGLGGTFTATREPAP